MKLKDKLVVAGLVQMISIVALVLLVEFPVVLVLVLALSPVIPIGIASYLAYKEEAKERRFLTPEESQEAVREEMAREAQEEP